MEKIYKKTFFPSDTILSDSVNFVEKSSVALGCEKKTALKLRLSCEEIISALYKDKKNLNPAEISIENKADRTVLSIKISPIGLDLKAFNLAYKPDLESKKNDLGLAIASRYVDDFSMEELQFEKILINFSINKKYEAKVKDIESPGEINFYRLVKPSRKLIMEFGSLLNKVYKTFDFYPDFFHPQRLNDLLSFGELSAVISVNENNRVTGGAFAIPTRPQMLEFFGPFVFSLNKKNETAKDLACHLLEKVARKNYKGVFCTFYDNSYFPEKYFIPAGKIQNKNLQKTAWYFPLSDDEGGKTFIHPSIKDYVLNSIEKQDLPRDISIIETDSVPEIKSSVLASKISRQTKTSAVKILLSGSDFEENIDIHMDYFKDLGIENFTVDLDLCDKFQALASPVLIKKGFKPLIFLPCGAKGDLLVMSKTISFTGDEN
jgi:anti-sigma regulatory factor (Ser/Thr protein kinase)